LERRSISIEPDLNRRILRFRAFFMSHGIDVDYTAAITLLAGYGFDELQKSGFSAGLLERLDSKGALDEATREVISSDWLKGKMPGFSAGDLELDTKESPSEDARTIHPPRLAQPGLKAVSALCVKCGVVRQMKDPHIETLKNGRQAIRGICPICGSKMVHFGIPR
jgi:hypothetical protein